MKIFVSKLDNMYNVHTNESSSYDHVIEVSEQKFIEWENALRHFDQTQEEICQAIFQHYLKQEDIDHLKRCFATSANRAQKGYILTRFGWKQVDTSLWEKDGKQLRIHEAYDECKRNFEETTVRGELEKS